MESSSDEITPTSSPRESEDAEMEVEQASSSISMTPSKTGSHTPEAGSSHIFSPNSQLSSESEEPQSEYNLDVEGIPEKILIEAEEDARMEELKAFQKGKREQRKQEKMQSQAYTSVDHSLGYQEPSSNLESHELSDEDIEEEAEVILYSDNYEQESRQTFENEVIYERVDANPETVEEHHDNGLVYEQPEDDDMSAQMAEQEVFHEHYEEGEYIEGEEYAGEDDEGEDIYEDDEADREEEAELSAEADYESQEGESSDEYDLEDIDPDEEDDNYVGYIPRRIPPMLEDQRDAIFLPILKKFNKIISDPKGKKVVMVSVDEEVTSSRVESSDISSLVAMDAISDVPSEVSREMSQDVSEGTEPVDSQEAEGLDENESEEMEVDAEDETGEFEDNFSSEDENNKDENEGGEEKREINDDELDLSELQSNVEALYHENLFTQLAVIDELSRLLTGNRAVLDDGESMIEPEPTPEEILPTASSTMKEHMVSCLEKDQNKLYLVELWWAWVENLMPDITSDFVKKFRTMMIDKLKPRILETTEEQLEFGHRSGTPEREEKLKKFDVKLYDLQVFEDHEIASDYEDETGPIYYRTEIEENQEEKDGIKVARRIFRKKTNEEEDASDEPSEVLEEEEEIKPRTRRSTLNESPPPSKRGPATESFDAPILTQNIPISRRISTMSHQSSASPPLLSPAYRQSTSIPQTPVKDTSSIFSSPPILFKKPDDRPSPAKTLVDTVKVAQKQTGKRNRRILRRHLFKKYTFNLDLGLPAYRPVPTEDKSTNGVDKGCDSDEIDAVTDEIRRDLYLNESDDSSVELNDVENLFQEDEEDTAVLKTSKKEKPQNPLKDSDNSDTPPDSDNETSPSDQELDAQKPDYPQSFVLSNGIEVKGRMLAKLINAEILQPDSQGNLIDVTEGEGVFVQKKAPPKNIDEMDEVTREMYKLAMQLSNTNHLLKEQSKLVNEFLLEEMERRKEVKALSTAEGMVDDMLDIPFADALEMNNSFMHLANYYKNEGVIFENLEEATIELMGLKATNLDKGSRKF